MITPAAEVLADLDRLDISIQKHPPVPSPNTCCCCIFAVLEQNKSPKTPSLNDIR